MMGDLGEFLGDRLRREDKIDASACDRTLRHIRLEGGVRPLRDGNAPSLLDPAQRGGAITVIPGYNDCDKLAAPMLGHGLQKHRNDIGPPARLRDGLEPK